MGRWPLCESRGLEIRRRGLSLWAPRPPHRTQTHRPQLFSIQNHRASRPPHRPLFGKLCHAPTVFSPMMPEGDSGQAPNLLGDGSKCLPGFSGKQKPSWD